MPIDFNCPICGKLLRVPDESAGKQARCPHCGDVTTIPLPDPALRASASQATSGDPFRLQPLGVGGSFKPDESNPFASPAMTGGDAPLDPAASLEAARGRVFGPALSLLIISGLSVLVALFVIGSVIFTFVIQKNQQQDMPPVLFVNAPYMASILLLAFIFYGAWQLKNLRQYGMAMTAAILSLLPCNCLFFLTIPFGIWALVVLLSDEVKWGFDQTRGR